MITLYHYPRCSTCVKARKWLEAQGLEFKAIDLASAPPSKSELKVIHERSGRPIKALFNTSGQSYRGGGFKDRLPSMSDADKFEALAADGMLIKRPIALMEGRHHSMPPSTRIMMIRQTTAQKRHMSLVSARPTQELRPLP